MDVETAETDAGMLIAIETSGAGAALALSFDAIAHLREIMEARLTLPWRPACPVGCELCAEIREAVRDA